MYKVEIPCTVCSVMSTKTLPNKSSAILKYETGEKKCFCSKDCRKKWFEQKHFCLLYTSPSPRDRQKSRMPSSA